MKPLHKFLMVISFLLLQLAFVYGQATPLQEQLLGSWKIDVQLMSQELEREASQTYLKLEENQKSRFFESLGSRLYLFHSEGYFEAFYLNNGHSLHVVGEWEVKKGALLLITTESGQSNYKVQQLTDQTLVLDAMENTNGLLDKLIFKRKQL